MGRRHVHLMRDGRFLRSLNPSRELLFWLKVEGDGFEECWLWQAVTDEKGYGLFVAEVGVVTRAHRFAYESMVGPVPKGLHLDHLCRTPRCVNPWHLEPVTPLVNTRRGEGNVSKMHCPQGHLYDASTVSNGYRRRVCSECRRAAFRRWYYANRSAA